MSLEQVDQLIGILYNERMKELMEENKRLRLAITTKTYGIYVQNEFDYSYELIDAIVCDEKRIEKLARESISAYICERHTLFNTCDTKYIEPDEFSNINSFGDVLNFRFKIIDPK